MSFAFVHIPKTAGSSVKAWCDRYRTRSMNSTGLPFYYIHHTELDYFNNIVRFKVDTSFTVVRNTYDRMRSYYNFMNWFLPNVALKSQITQEGIEREKLWIEHWKKGIVYFTDRVRESRVYAGIDQIEYSKNVDIIINYENLNEEFQQIQRLVNKFNPLENINVTPPKAKKFTEYTDEYIKCIQRNYAEELEHFKYTPY